MSRLFGWSYPPGCNSTPFDEEYPCEICGEMPDDCICPECPICGSTGDPDCYRGHGMQRNEIQKFNLEVNERLWAKETERENKYYEQYFDDDIFSEKV